MTNIEEIENFYEYSEDSLRKIQQLSVPTSTEIEGLLVNLPFELNGKKLAVFDIDETLIHCEIHDVKSSDKTVKIKLPNGKTATVGINIRPYMHELLQEVSKHYVIIAFTASLHYYADAVLDLFDKERKLIKYRLYRQDCVKVNHDGDSYHVKDLRILKNVNMKDVIIIDNSMISFAFQLDNGVPILPFYNNYADTEFKFLLNYLMHVKDCYDIRVENKKLFKLNEILEISIDENSKNFEETNDDENDRNFSNITPGIMSDDQSGITSNFNFSLLEKRSFSPTKISENWYMKKQEELGNFSKLSQSNLSMNIISPFYTTKQSEVSQCSELCLTTKNSVEISISDTKRSITQLTLSMLLDDLHVMFLGNKNSEK